MNYLTRVIISFFAVISTFSLSLAPVVVHAKVAPKIKAPVVKKVVKASEVSSATRCLTPAMTNLNKTTVKKMELDIAKYGKGHESAVKLYREKIELSWAAMHEPYCGVGSMGMTAVKKSYLKGTQRARTEFLAATKK